MPTATTIPMFKSNSSMYVTHTSEYNEALLYHFICCCQESPLWSAKAPNKYSWLLAILQETSPDHSSKESCLRTIGPQDENVPPSHLHKQVPWKYTHYSSTLRYL